MTTMANDPVTRGLSGFTRQKLIESMTHLRQLQALALERHDLRRAHRLGRFAKAFQVELDRRDTAARR